MTRLWPDGEAIAMSVDAHGQPVAFVWRGRRHRLERIQQRWRVDADWWSEAGRVWRDYLTVTTANGLLCVLYYDLLAEGWFLEKVYD